MRDSGFCVNKDRDEEEISVSIEFFHPLSQITRTRKMEIGIKKNANLNDLIEHLKEMLGESFLEYLYISETGVSNPYVYIVLDGKLVLLPQYTNVRLKNGSEVIFLSPIGGG